MRSPSPAPLARTSTGIAFVYDPIVPVSGTGYIPAEVIESQQADNEAAAKAAIDRFAAATDARRTVGGAADAHRQLCRRRRSVRPHRAALRSQRR